MQTILRVFIATIFIALSVSAQAQSGRLFHPPKKVRTDMKRPAHATASKFRAVGVNRGILGHDRFILELFDGEHIAVRDRLDKFKGGSFIWVGHLETEPDSQVLFAFKKNSVSGFITREGETIELGANRDGQMALYIVDESVLPPIEPSVLPEADKGGKSARTEAFTGYVEGPVVQDLLVVYTQASCDQRGGCGNLEADILAAFGDTNQAFVNSEVAIEMNLTGMEWVDYNENGIVQSLKHLTWQQGHSEDTDGFLDEVHDYRDQTVADLVVLITDDSDYCGVGWVNSSAETAFSVVNWSCLSNRSLSHEIGHNQGNEHNRENAYVNGFFDYSHGHRVCEGNHAFRTIMSYNSECGVTRVNYFSNPDVKYKGQDTGISEIDFPSTSANNALTLNQTAPLVANFRQDSNASLQIIQPEAQQNSIGDTIALQIETINNSNNSLEFSAIGLPAETSIDAQSGLITGTLNEDAVDEYTVIVYASNQIQTVAVKFDWQVTQTDGTGDDDSSTSADPCTAGAVGFVYYADYAFSYNKPEIVTPPAPVEPTVTDPGSQQNDAGDDVLLQIQASDENDYTLTFSATGLPAGLVIDEFTGLISGHIDGASVGSHSATVTVTNGALDKQTVIPWTVNSNIGVSLTVDSDTINEGESILLDWTVSNATSCTAIGGAPGWAGTSITLPSASKDITIDVDGDYDDDNYTFTLRCTDASGTLVSQDESVTVNDISIAISSFNASPTSINEGQTTTLSWVVINATSCTATGGAPGWAGTSITVPSGSKDITVDVDSDYDDDNYTFTLRCTNASGTLVSQDESVTVNDISIAISSFNASPTSIYEGETTTLSWAVLNATSCTAIGGAPGWVGTSITVPSGSKDITVDIDSDYDDDNYTFTLRCTNASGTFDSKDKSVTVNDVSIAIDSFNASPEELDVNSSTGLSWVVLGADNCTASGGADGWDGSNVSATSGSRTINFDTPDIYTFTLSCSNDGGGVASNSIQTTVLEAIEFEYDARGRLIKIIDHSGDEATYTLDDAGNRVEIERN